MKKLKHLGILFLILLATATYAQPGETDRKDAKKEDKIKALKIGFFTESLDLTSAESQKFWPIYNKFEDAKRSLGKKPSRTDIEKMTDAELNQLLQTQFDRKQQMLTFSQQLVEELRPVLPLRKIVKLNDVEKKFRKDLLKRLGKKRGGDKKKDGDKSMKQKRKHDGN